MPDLWIPGIPRVDCSAYGLLLGKGGNDDDAFHTWHTFEGIPKDYNFGAMTGARYLASTLKLAHFVYNPVWGGLVQLLPANMAARTLQVQGPNGVVETNRYGKIHMQTEVLANAARPWTFDLTREGIDDLTLLMNFLRSWDVPDQWAWRDTIRPATTYTEANAPGYRRYPDQSGHAFHSRWPANSHWDPGAIDPPWTFVPRPVQYAPPPPPRIEDDPNKGFDLEHLERVESLLDVLGYEGTDVWARTAAFQDDFGLTIDGLPGTQETTPHLEEAMTKLDEILAAVNAVPRNTANRVLTFKNVEVAGNTDVFGHIVTASRAARESAAKAAAAEAALAVLAEQTTGVDVEAVKEAARVGAAEALAALDFEVTAVTTTKEN